MKTFVRKPGRYLALLLAMIMALSMSMTAFASDTEGSTSDVVAMIGTTKYTSLDDAVSAAESGDTIVVLQDCTLENGLNISASKTLTIQGSSNVDPTITFENYGIAMWSGSSLTFEDLKVNITDIGTTPYTAEWNWGTIIAVEATLTLDNVDFTMDGENATNYAGTSTSVHAIFLDSGCTLNILNGSYLLIENYEEDALEWDGGSKSYEVNITNSTYVSDSNRSGFTGTFYAYITNSTVIVKDSTGNGSNGTYYDIDNSYVSFTGNRNWGISAYKITMTNNSTLIANDNGYSGIWTRIINVDGTCTVDVERNGNHSTGATTNAGIFFQGNGSETSTIEEGASLTIVNNAGSGIYSKQSVGNLTIYSGTITNNGTGKVDTYNGYGATYGGGIYNTANGYIYLDSDVVIYNNHASEAGDDIYSVATGESKGVVFGATQDDWVLDDCDDYIDGWYYDGLYTETVSSTDEETGETTESESTVYTRWEAHALDSDEDDIEENFIHEYEVETSASVLGTTIALKAAHGIDAESSEKDSEPGIEKKILVTTESTDEEGNTTTETTEVDSYSVNAGDTVTFQLTSNVPDYLLSYLDFEYTDGDDESNEDSDEENEEDESTGGSDTDTDTDGDSGSTDTDTDTGSGSSDGDETESGSVSSESTVAAASADDGIAVVDATVKEESSYVITFHDVLDSAFTLNQSSFIVTIGGETLNSEYYTLVFSGDVDSDGNAIITDGCTFELSIDLAELYRDGIIDEEDIEAAVEIVVTYSATLSSDATAGKYTNQAWVEYEGTTTDKPEVDVYVYGIKIYKIDEDGTTSEEDEDGNVTYTYTYLEGATFTLYSDSSLGEDYVVATLTTNENGYLCFDGLAAGTYYLVETDAPDGYVGSTAAVTITLPEDDNSVTSYYYESIINNAAIPSTGGMGTTILYIIGVALILCAGIVLVTRRRMNGRD